MGMDFRDGNYRRRVWLGKRTVKEGECAVVWDSSGRATQVVGPRVRYMWFSTIEFMTRFSATSDQYLMIRFRDGSREHVRGPCELFRDPTKHSRIEVVRAVALASAQHFVVVVQNVAGPAQRLGLGGKGSTVAPAGVGAPEEGRGDSLRVVRGPALLVPAPDEQLLVFPGMGADACAAEPAATAVATVHYAGPRSALHELPFLERGGQRCTVTLELRTRVVDVERFARSSADPCADLLGALAHDLAGLGAGLALQELLDEAARAAFLAALAALPSHQGGRMRSAASETGVEVLGLKVLGLGGALESHLRAQEERRREHDAAVARIENEDRQLRLRTEKTAQLVNDEAALASARKLAELELNETVMARQMRLLEVQNSEVVSLLSRLHLAGVSTEKMFEHQKLSELRSPGCC
jgi:hypothetical protein